jgi:hypothetical protein
VDAFANGITGESDDADTRVHGGVGARIKF